MSELRCRHCGRQASYYYSDHQIGIAKEIRSGHEERCSFNPERLEAEDEQ